MINDSKLQKSGISFLLILLFASLSLTACQTELASASLSQSTSGEPPAEAVEDSFEAISTPFPTRPSYAPGELVDYTAQSGDNLPALAIRFNTTVTEIMEANPMIPAGATTMPPGMPMRIPIYFAPFWGTPFAILPDSFFVNGPAQVSFDTSDFVAQHPGWLRDYTTYATGANRTGAQLVDLIATNYSISPRLLLALLEFHSGALSRPSPTSNDLLYALGYPSPRQAGLYNQLAWTANTLNNGYYNWRQGKLTTLEFSNGRLERPDPWHNAATAGLQYYFSLILSQEEYNHAVSPNGLYQVYVSLFGEPWTAEQPHIPGSLVQPEFVLPFQPNRTWALTGGPHTAWGDGEPFAALDFAPPSVAGGCTPTTEWATAVANGVIARSETGIVVLDLDGDGDERTGWSVFYLHVATENRATTGTVVSAGDPIGHPSCEAGRSTGTHIHIARKYNGEWIPSEGTLAFNLEGWVAQNGSRPYLGTLTRHSQTVYANENAATSSHITSAR
jgi:LasA protease